MSKTTLSILGSILLGSAPGPSVSAMAEATRNVPHAAESHRNPLAARFDRFGERR